MLNETNEIRRELISAIKKSKNTVPGWDELTCSVITPVTDVEGELQEFYIICH